LTALRIRGETADELVGAAEALRSQAVPFPFSRSGLLDTCGTGGDGSGTFNVSTAAAIVAAACGVPVAKHGNRSFSSSSGSADVLSELGVNTLCDAPGASRKLEQIGLAFFFAGQWHPAVGRMQSVRRALGFRTLFNLLGPLCNPASPDFQVIGVGRHRGDLALHMAEAVRQLGVKSALVVQGSDGLDEVTLSGTTQVIVVRQAAVERTEWSPELLGLPHWPTSSWRVESPAESAAVIRGVLAGRPGPHRDLVLANAAAALVAAEAVAGPAEGVLRAAGAIDAGLAAAKLADLVRVSHHL
jgi:anthranilate phosphoribosyltransferase